MHFGLEHRPRRLTVTVAAPEFSAAGAQPGHKNLDWAIFNKNYAFLPDFGPLSPPGHSPGLVPSLNPEDQDVTEKLIR